MFYVEIYATYLFYFRRTDFYVKCEFPNFEVKIKMKEEKTCKGDVKELMITKVISRDMMNYIITK